MPDYSIFYRRSVDRNRIDQELPVFDIFVSAFNSSDRIQLVYNKVRARKKIWLIHPEYQYTLIEQPDTSPTINPSSIDEISQVNNLLEEMGELEGKHVCIDITGFMRHALLFLVAKLAYIGVREFTALYSEPMYYTKQELTTFSTTTPG